MNQIKEYNETTFERMKHKDQNGIEYWNARELMQALEYKRWDKFSNIIDNAKTACEKNKKNVKNHFTKFENTVSIGKSTKRKYVDYHLSRYACYLIVQNANSKKECVILGTKYFAPKTKKRKINALEYSNLSKEEQKLYKRNLIKKGTYSLKKRKAKQKNKKVEKIHSSSDKNLYNKEATKIITKRKLKKSIKKKLMIIMIIILSSIFIYSSYNVIIWFIENRQIAKITNELLEDVEITEVEDNEDTEIIAEEVEESNPYWDYIKMNMLDVDFNELKKINSDITGWIEVGGTNVNYPFVQTNDNNYYLTHSLDKSSNGAGWVFMDYRNSKDTLNKNTILYAHGRYNGTLFGSLRKITTNGWLNNSSNFYVKVATPNSLMIYQVFSIYIIKTTNDYLKTSFANDEEYLSFLEMLKNRSAYDFGISVNSEDKILTLSTCYDNYKKSVLHAKLIKYQINN